MINIGKCYKINIFDDSPVLISKPNRIKLSTDNLFIINEAYGYIANNKSFASSYYKWLKGVLIRHFLCLQP